MNSTELIKHFIRKQIANPTHGEISQRVFVRNALLSHDSGGYDIADKYYFWSLNRKCKTFSHVNFKEYFDSETWKLENELDKVCERTWKETQLIYGI